MLTQTEKILINYIKVVGLKGFSTFQELEQKLKNFLLNEKHFTKGDVEILTRGINWELVFNELNKRV